MTPRPSLRITRPDRREVMQALRVLGVVGALLAVALGVWQLEPTGRPQPGGGPEIPWWVLAVLFGAVEVTVLHVQVRREAQTLSLSTVLTDLVPGAFRHARGGRLAPPPSGSC